MIPILKSSHGLTGHGVYLQAFSLPSLQPCLPQNELLMTPCAFIFLTVLSGCNWPSQTFDSFYTDSQGLSLCRPFTQISTPVTSSDHRSNVSLPTLILFPLQKGVIPCLSVCSSMHNVAKEPLSFAQTAKADVGGRPPAPRRPQHIRGKSIRSVKICMDEIIREVDLRL